jgi:hypothetical protein
VISLTEPEGCQFRSLRGSEDRSEVIAPGAGDIELDEVVYTKGDTALASPRPGMTSPHINGEVKQRR